MRKSLFAISLLGAMTLALAVSAAAPANFAGTWNLDKAKSQGLSQRLQGADSVSWVITQTDKEISIETKITGGQPPAGGAPAGAPPGGGGRGPGMGGPQTYKLDGSETNSENGTAKTTRKATWSSDGKTLELSSKSTFTGQDGTERTSASTDKLQLSGDGKVLTVNRHSEGGRGGPQDSTLVFNK
jgi:hypothetical protein